MLDTSEAILRYVKEKTQATSKQIIEHVGLPRSSVSKEIQKLTDSGQLIKIGVPPKEVVYRLPNVSAQSPVNVTEKAEQAKQEPGPDGTIGVGFWAGVLARFKIDAELVKQRAQAIGTFFDPLYDQWETFRGMHQSSYLLTYVRRICGGIIWVMALVSVLVYRGGPSGVIARNPQDKGGQSCLPVGRCSTVPISKDTIATVARIAILLLIGGIIGYQMHHMRPGHNEVDLANQLEKTQKELSDTQFALSETKGRLSQLDNQNKDLQEALGKAQAETKSLNDQIYQKDQQISKLEQEKESLSNQSQQQVQTLQQKIDYLEEQNRLGQEQSKKDQAEIERLKDKGGQFNSTQDQGGQLNSTVPISYIPMNQIVAWSNQGVPSDEIINRIKSSHSAYWLTANDLAWLRQQGVSEEAIQFMASSGPLRDKGGQLNSTVPISKKILGWIQNKINGE